MKKHYIVAVVFVIILSAFLYGCENQEKKNYCCKCDKITSTWVRVPSFELSTHDLKTIESDDYFGGAYVFYLCDDCMERCGFRIIRVDSLWDDE